jgi:prolipoprotein diacylglyceryltransferase
VAPTWELGPYLVSTWSTIVAGGVLLCWALLLRRTAALGYPTAKVFGLVVLALPAGALGAGVAATLAAPWAGPESPTDPRMLQSGRTVLGAIIACFLFALVYCRVVLREWPWRILDALAFTFPLSVAVGRIGCLFNGCCRGGLAGTWTEGTPAAAFTLHSSSLVTVEGFTAEGVLWNLPVLLSLNALWVLVATEWVWRRRERWGLPPGAVMAWAIWLDSGGRFLLEFLRDEPALWFGVSRWQVIVVDLWLVATPLVVIGARRAWAGRSVEPQPPPAEPASDGEPPAEGPPADP